MNIKSSFGKWDVENYKKKCCIILQVVNPGEIIGDLDEKAAKELGLQQWNQTKGTVYRLDSKTLPTLRLWYI